MELTTYKSGVIEKRLGEVEHRKDELDLVILPGLMRTGTTVLFQCIRGTQGFMEVHEARLLGTPESEHQSFRFVNYIVSKMLFGCESIPEGTKIDKEHAGILYDKKYTVDERPVNGVCKTLMNEAMKVFAYQELKILKEPMCQFALEAWLSEYESFRNAKYIWTIRDIREIAKSFMRLKLMGATREDFIGKITTKQVESYFEQHEAELEKVMHKLTHVKIHHDDIVNKPKVVFGIISEFLETDINTAYYDRGKVYARA